MIKDNDILKVCDYWARVLTNKFVPHDALVNEAYLVCTSLKDPRLLQQWVKWTMIHYIQQEKFTRNMCETSKIPGIDNNRRSAMGAAEGKTIPGQMDIQDYLEDKSFDDKEYDEVKEEMQAIVDRMCSKKEKILLNKRINEGKTLRQIAEEEHITYQAVYFRYKTVLDKLRSEHERRR